MPVAICDRCGFRFNRSQLKRDWQGLMVCGPDFDPKPAHLSPPDVYPEGLPIPDARPEPPVVELGDNDVQPEDL